MKLQNLISMLSSQLKEEEICHETAIRDKKFFKIHEIEQRIASLKKALHKITASVMEKEYISTVEFQLL